MRDFEVHPMATARRLMGGAGIDLYAADATISCELDGEPVARVRYTGTRFDADRSHVVLIKSDAMIAAQLASNTCPEAPGLTLVHPDSSKKKNNVTGGGGSKSDSGSSGELKPVGNSELPNLISLLLWASGSLRFVRSSLTMAWKKSNVRWRAATLALLASLNVGCAHTDEWTTRDTAMQAGVTILVACDAHLTAHLKDSGGFTEDGNLPKLVLGRTPKSSDTYMYFASLAVFDYLLSRALAAKWRPYWQEFNRVDHGYGITRHCVEGLC